MRDRIIEAIVARILTVLPEGETHGRDAVQAAVSGIGAPSSLVNFLDRTLERRTQIEIREALDGTFSWFNTADSGVIGAMEHLQHEALRAAWFPPEEWNRAVHHATETTLSYLVDPVQTLVSFVFADGSDSVLASDARRRSGFFREYTHLTRAVGAFIDKRKEDRISRHELTGMLRHVDRNIVSEFDTDAWMDHMAPLLTLVSFSGLISEGLPVSFALRFLESRGHTAARNAVETAAGKARADMVSVPTLRSLLHALGTVETAPDNPARPAAPAAMEQSDQPSPLWKQFSNSNRGSQQASNTPPPTAAEPLWKTFQERTSPVQPDLSGLERNVVGAAGPDRARVVSELFAGDENLYRTVLSRLHAAPDWTAASRILANDVYRPHAVDIYSETAVAFTNAVESRFHRHPNQS